MKHLRQYIKETLSENYSPRYRYVYHGTTEKAGEEIEESGFDTSLVGIKSGDKANKGISFSTDQNIAVEHAVWAWANAGKDPEAYLAMVVARVSGLKIMSGADFNRVWDDLGSHPAALDAAKSQGYQAVEYFDLETGEGIEEMELLVFPEFVDVHRVNYMNTEDFPEIVENY